jgi:hypothetical protein
MIEIYLNHKIKPLTPTPKDYERAYKYQKQDRKYSFKWTTPIPCQSFHPGNHKNPIIFVEFFLSNIKMHFDTSILPNVQL